MTTVYEGSEIQPELEPGSSESWSDAFPTELLELRHWSSGTGAQALELRHWSSGTGAQALELRHWSSGTGAEEIIICSNALQSSSVQKTQAQIPAAPQSSCNNNISCLDNLLFTDVGECHNCDPNAECVNTDGGYSCTCVAGYEGSGHTCNSKYHCINELNMNTLSMEACCLLMHPDIDECLEGSHTCRVGAECIDTMGGYNCSCWDGYYWDGFACLLPEG